MTVMTAVQRKRIVIMLIKKTRTCDVFGGYKLQDFPNFIDCAF